MAIALKLSDESEMNMAATRVAELGTYLRQTAADQGGECTFAEWVIAVANDEEEFGHEEAVEFVALGGDTSEEPII